MSRKQAETVDLITSEQPVFTQEAYVPPGHVRRARLFVHPWQLQDLLGLPPGVTIRHIGPSVDPHGLVVVVEGGSLEPVPHDTEAPPAPGAFMRETVMVDGKQYVRLVWDDAPFTDAKPDAK